MSGIASTQEEIMQRLERLEQQSNNRWETPGSTSSSGCTREEEANLPDFKQLFPIKNDEEINDIEIKLNEKKFKTQLVSLHD